MSFTLVDILLSYQLEMHNEQGIKERLSSLIAAARKECDDLFGA